MKIILSAIAALALSGAAMADTTLAPITAPVVKQNGPTHCAGNSFNADGSIQGACSTVQGQACSGRGCQPVTYTTFYNVTWSVPDLVPSTPDACVTVRHHLPQADQYTYLNGHVATDCHGLSLGSSSVTMVNGAPYYLIAVSPTGLYEIVANFGDSWFVTF